MAFFTAGAAAHGDRDVSAAGAGGVNDLGAVERGVGPNPDRPVRAQERSGRGQGVGDHPFHPAWGPAPLRSRCPMMTGALAEVARVASRAFRPRTPGVAEPGALFLVAVDLQDRVVNVEEREPGQPLTVVTFRAWVWRRARHRA